jgi:hypothetical protein
MGGGANLCRHFVATNILDNGCHAGEGIKVQQLL